MLGINSDITSRKRNLNQPYLKVVHPSLFNVIANKKIPDMTQSNACLIAVYFGLTKFSPSKLNAIILHNGIIFPNLIEVKSMEPLNADKEIIALSTKI